MQKSTKRFCNGEVMCICKALLLCFLLAGNAVQLNAQSYQSLNDKVTLNLDHTNAAAVVKSLEQQTNYTFTYDPEYLQHISLEAVKFNGQSLSAVLSYLDAYAPIDIAFSNNTVALKQGRQLKQAGVDKGRITGKVMDSKNEPLPGVTIQTNDGQGTVSGIDGAYDLMVTPGTYTLTFSFVSYETRKVTDVSVDEKGNTPLSIVLKNSGSQLREVTVTGSYKKASVEGLYALQKNSAFITDGISAEQIARTPDKNIGEVLKRVSGLSTMDNKYVVVRGLSERYNQAVLNGQVMPSTELNRKNFSFDIIPSNIVENVIVVKTLTADRSAEFGGGLIEVTTLDIPTSNFFNISAGGSYNDKTTGKPFISLAREKGEYFGKVADHRKLLGQLDWKNTTDVTNKYNATGKGPAQFSNNWGLYQYNAPVSQNYQISGGRVFNVGGTNQIGFVASASYRNTFSRQDVRMSRDGFQVADTSASEYAGYTGNRFGFTTNIGGLVGFGFRNAKHRVGFQSLYLRTLDEQMILGTGSAAAGGIRVGLYDLTTQTTLAQQQLKGEHSLGGRGLKFKWMGSYLQLDRLKPDNHQLTSEYINPDSTLNGYSIIAGGSNAINKGALRWWSRALEKNYNWDASLSMPFRFDAGKVAINSTAKAGYAGWNKDRLFYVLNVGTFFNNPNDYYQPLATAFSAENGVDFEFSKFGDDFHRSASLHAAYGMIDSKIGERFRLVMGLRAEYYNLNKTNAALDSLFRYINASRDANTKFDYSELLNREKNWHLFPSFNLTYSLNQTMNLRGAYSRSIIRPDLRELSFFREYDFELGGAYESELVRSTLAQHVDFRYEWFPGAGEIMSFSLFYKKFDYSMEIYADEQSGGIYRLRNNKKAENYGMEVEIRKSLAFTEVPVIKNLTLYGNLTMLESWVTPMSVNYNALDPNNETKVTPVETIGKMEKRPQTGASNFIVNAGAYYDIKPVSLSLVYNYISNRMFRPDQYYQFSLFERPLETLDGQIAIRFLKNKGEFKFNIGNILNKAMLVYSNRYTDQDMVDGKKKPSNKDLLYQKGLDVIDYEARPGRTYSTTISFRF